MQKMEEITLDELRNNGYSDDLLPKQASWGVANYFTLWQGSVHNVPNYITIGGFLMLGISIFSVMGAIALSGLIVGIIIALNGAAGSRYHVPFPMLLRASYGIKGAFLPGILRGIIAAIMWFGLQNFLGSVAIYIIIAKIWPDFIELGGDTLILGLSVSSWIAFLLFCGANIAIGMGGGNTIKKFTGFLNPCIYITFIGMAIWGVYVAGGFTAIFAYSSALIEPKGGELYSILFIINALVAVWAAPIASAADFTQHSSSFRTQATGQILGLTIAYVIFAIASVCILVGASIYYQTTEWNILTIIERWHTVTIAILVAIVLAMTTISTNATGNIVPAAYQIISLFPKLSYKQGVIIASIISIVICPWKLVEQRESIFAFLAIIGATLGPVVGVMLSHYFIVIKQKIDLRDLYVKSGSYSYYRGGINSLAFIATIVAVLISLFAQDIPGLAFLGDFSFFVGIACSFILYTLMYLPHIIKGEIPGKYHPK